MIDEIRDSSATSDGYWLSSCPMIARQSRYSGSDEASARAPVAFPLFHSSHAPAVFRSRIDTTAGSFVIESHRDWSPKGADRFYELVREHYYDNSRFFRVVPGRWVQFGIAGDPKVAQAWHHSTLPLTGLCRQIE